MSWEGGREVGDEDLAGDRGVEQVSLAKGREDGEEDLAWS